MHLQDMVGHLAGVNRMLYLSEQCLVPSLSGHS